MPQAKSSKAAMSEEHKAALAKGREEARIVRAYLEALRATKPKRGRKRSAESVNKRLVAVDAELETASPMNELHLVQERRDLQTELDKMSKTIDMTSLEVAFVGVAKSYSESKKISYASWREVGVAAKVLNSAGITRGD